jgi:hypothetical protein
MIKRGLGDSNIHPFPIIKNLSNQEGGTHFFRTTQVLIGTGYLAMNQTPLSMSE